MRHWLEWLIAYHFREGLNQVLFHACLSQGVPKRICEWYWIAMVIDIDLRKYKRLTTSELKLKRSQEQC